ncbi:MAG: hypothetical protein E6713_10790 [Sporomusaceae bacterium]|nr:hypothetical protein [Sporomusaceae bacterium]
MRNNFWQGLLLGGLAATVLAALTSPWQEHHRKPLVERGVEAVKGTANELARKAVRTRRRIMRP